MLQAFKAGFRIPPGDRRVLPAGKGAITGIPLQQRHAHHLARTVLQVSVHPKPLRFVLVNPGETALTRIAFQKRTSSGLGQTGNSRLFSLAVTWALSQNVSGLEHKGRRVHL